MVYLHHKQNRRVDVFLVTLLRISRDKAFESCTIKLQNNHCDCKIVCSSCGVCTHHFICTCLDSTLRSTVCKHIHFLITAEVGKTCSIISMRQPTVEFSNKNVHQYVQNKGQNREEYELIQLKDSIYALTI